MKKRLKKLCTISIDDRGFKRLVELKDKFEGEIAKIPNKVEVIGKDVFKNNDTIRDFIFGRKNLLIDSYALENCSKLEKLFIPKRIQLNQFAVKNCKNLTFVERPFEFYEKKVFVGCDNLKYIGFTKDTIYLASKENCKKIPTRNVISVEALQKSFINFDICDCYKLFIKGRSNFATYDLALQNQTEYINTLHEISSILNEQKTKVHHDYLLHLLDNVYNLKSDCVKFFNEHDFSYFRQIAYNPILNKLNSSQLVGLYVFAESIGCFEKDLKIRQRACEFIKHEVLANSPNKLANLCDIFTFLKNCKYHAEYSNFILNKKNFANIIDICKNGTQSFDENLYSDIDVSSFLAFCHDKFDYVQKAHTSNRGSQRQLAPTVDFFLTFFKCNNFANINADNLYIADEISKFFVDKDTFQNALKLVDEFKKRKVPTSLLKDEQKLENDRAFDLIMQYQKDIAKNSSSVLKIFSQISQKNFTYEWLKKDDVINMVLGKYCDCCSHLEGAGYGIMRASMISKDCQNLIIKDKNGEIVAKSTLYVNKKYGYAVFNNVEVKETISDNFFSRDFYDNVRSIDKEIYLALKKGIIDFVENYNRENPDNKLQVVTVGAHLNDLIDVIRETDQESKVNYPAKHYGLYGEDVYGSYEGDSQISQYILWKSEDCAIDKYVKLKAREIDKEVQKEDKIEGKSDDDGQIIHMEDEVENW